MVWRIALPNTMLCTIRQNRSTVKPEILAAIIFSVFGRVHILAAINISILKVMDIITVNEHVKIQCMKPEIQ